MYLSCKRNIAVSLLFSLSLICSGPAMAQDTAVGSSAVGAFAGFTDRDDLDFTFGGEYDYRIRNLWSVGAVVEYTPDAVAGYDATVVMGTAKFHPTDVPRLHVIGGLGAEFKDFGGDDLKARLGAGYDLFLEGNITVTPRVTIDFGEGDENIVFGVTAFYGL